MHEIKKNLQGLGALLYSYLNIAQNKFPLSQGRPS